MPRTWAWAILALFAPFTSACLDDGPTSFAVPFPRVGDRAVYESWVEDTSSDVDYNHGQVFYKVMRTQETEMPWGERWQVARIDYGAPDAPEQASRLYVSLEGNLLVRRESCYDERCTEAAVHHPTTLLPWLLGASLLQGRDLRAGQTFEVPTNAGEVRFRVSDFDSPTVPRLWVETQGLDDSPFDGSFVFEAGNAFPTAITATYRQLNPVDGMPAPPIVIRYRLSEFNAGEGAPIPARTEIPERRNCVAGVAPAAGALPPGTDQTLPGFHASMREMLAAAAEYDLGLRARMKDPDFYVGDLRLSEDERPIVAAVGTSRTSTALIFYDISRQDWQMAILLKRTSEVAPLPPSTDYEYHGQTIERAPRAPIVENQHLARLDEVYATRTTHGPVESVRLRLDYGETVDNGLPAGMHYDYAITHRLGQRLVTDVYDSRTGCPEGGLLSPAEWRHPDGRLGLRPSWV